MLKRQNLLIYMLFACVLAWQAGFALHARGIKAAWSNVPPAPSGKSAGFMALGDSQLAYRVSGLMLQNLGNTGGRATMFQYYDYKALYDWFVLADRLDPESNFVPLLAAYYFGATKEADDLDYIIDYLVLIGQRPEGEKWRWLAHGVYLARFVQGDLNRAFELASLLASLWQEGRPGWMKQMPVFILNAQGDKDSAYRMMITILKEEGDRLHPNEVRFMKDYICNKLLSSAEAQENPLCTSGAQAVE
jgi:hypothetical protein